MDKARIQLVSETLWKHHQEGVPDPMPKDEYDCCAQEILEALDKYDQREAEAYRLLAVDPEFQERLRRQVENPGSANPRPVRQRDVYGDGKPRYGDVF